MSLAQWSAVRPTPLHWAFVLPLAYGVLSLAWAPAIHPWALQQLAILFAGYVIGYYFDVRYVVIPITLGTAAFFAWAAWLSPITFNPMILGEMAVLVLIALVVERLYWLAPLMVPTIALSHSRGVFACAALGLVATFYRRPLVILCALLVATLAFLYFAGPTDIVRIRIWAAAIDYLRPWGNGLGSFRDLYLTLNGASWHPVEVHNDALQLVFELGLARCPCFGSSPSPSPGPAQPTGPPSSPSSSWAPSRSRSTPRSQLWSAR